MFIIDSKFQYIFHFASTKEIADAIKEDLASREDCEHPELVTAEDHGDKHAGWDPGGVLMKGDKTFVFELDNIKIEIYRQHYTYFVDWIQHASLREWFDTKYYKIHSGYMSCLCITPNELAELKRQISNPELALKASVSYHERQAAIEDSFEQVAEAQDENGNSVVVKIKKKDPILN